MSLLALAKGYYEQIKEQHDCFIIPAELREWERAVHGLLHIYLMIIY